MEKEFIAMMQRCREELLTQRNRINQLQPKADAYDNIAVILGLLPRGGGIMGEDLVWTLNKRIEEMTKAQVNPTPET